MGKKVNSLYYLNFYIYTLELFIRYTYTHTHIYINEIGE